MLSSESREDWILREAQKRQPAERSAFLDGACAGNLALRQRIESLLAAQEDGVTATGAAHDEELLTIKVSLANGVLPKNSVATDRLSSKGLRSRFLSRPHCR